MRTIGKYEVVEKIGEGGFGTIFKGFDPHIRRFVAIKSCSSEEQDVRNRFFHEAQIAGNLQHRHIVTVYDFGVQDEVPYLVQEYLSGEDLDRKVKRKEFLPLPEKILYLVQVARGLEYAHSKGVVHRDIKPANIRILEDGTAKIMDFGIAKLTNQDTGLTQTGMTLGTAAYLAPEQIRGEAVGPGTDIFSWGVTAWELLSYQRPFTGQHISTVLYQILNEPPPALRAAAPEVPPELERIVDRCLEKKPERRYGNCTELLRDLDTAIKARRLLPQSGLSTLASDAQAELAETRAIAAQAVADDARTASLKAATAAAAAASSELGDFDLEGTGDHRRTPHSISSTRAMRSRGFPWATWAAVAAGVLVLGAFGWWLARQILHSRHTARPTSVEASAEAGMALAASADGGALPPGATRTTTAATPPPAAAPTAAPTPVPTPRPSFLVVPAAWSPQIWVSVGRQQRRRLDREQRFTVAPGASTTVRFEYADGGYSDDAQRTVRVDEGATSRIEVPIQRPGLIQVQQKVGTPPGRVVLDGADLGLPIVRRTVKPGAHQVRIEPNVPGSGPLEGEIQVEAGKKLVLTYDLAGGKLVSKVGELPAS